MIIVSNLVESQEPASRSMGQPEKGDVWNFHLRKNGDGDDVGDGDGDDDGDGGGDDGDDGDDNDCICNDLLLQHLVQVLRAGEWELLQPERRFKW